MAHTEKEDSRWYPAIVLLTRTFVKTPISFSCFLTSFPQSLSLFSPFTKDLKQIKFYWAQQFGFFFPPVGSGLLFLVFFFFFGQLPPNFDQSNFFPFINISNYFNSSAGHFYT